MNNYPYASLYIFRKVALLLCQQLMKNESNIHDQLKTVVDKDYNFKNFAPKTD